MLFSSLDRFVLGNTVPEVLSTLSTGNDGTQDLGHSCSQNGPLGW